MVIVYAFLCVAPDGCVQYYTEKSGSFESFNYNKGMGHYLGDLNYAVCFKRNQDTCGIRWAIELFQYTYYMYNVLRKRRKYNNFIVMYRTTVILQVDNFRRHRFIVIILNVFFFSWLFYCCTRAIRDFVDNNTLLYIILLLTGCHRLRRYEATKFQVAYNRKLTESTDRDCDTEADVDAGTTTKAPQTTGSTTAAQTTLGPEGTTTTVAQTTLASEGTTTAAGQTTVEVVSTTTASREARRRKLSSNVHSDYLLIPDGQFSGRVFASKYCDKSLKTLDEITGIHRFMLCNYFFIFLSVRIAYAVYGRERWNLDDRCREPKTRRAGRQKYSSISFPLIRSND